MKNVGRARNWPLWAGDLYTEVTVTAGLTILLNMYKSEDFVDAPIPVEFSVRQIHWTGRTNNVIGPICLISSRTEMSDVLPILCILYIHIYSESDRYKFGPMKCFS